MYKEFSHKGHVDILISNLITGYFDKKYYRACQCKKKLAHDMDEYLNPGSEQLIFLTTGSREWLHGFPGCGQVQL